MFYLQIMIDFVARIFCMRSQVNDASLKNRRSRQGGKLINNDRVYGEQASDRLMFTEMQGEESGWRMSNGTSNLGSEQINTVQSDFKFPSNIERDIRDMKLYLTAMMNKHNKKEEHEKIAKEWKLVALVLDRLFFFIYLIIIIVSISTVFDFVLFGQDGNSSQ